ncbi:MAG TPA: ORF6N domain-containing protein [Candidatus Aphodocola excrementigallinarum]|uniref:ORF6N domain-containing protein n=1 Tax=Candidatus Aphodocola excrementigallinarum TaxID=2840670 RepID=A0A9D1LIS3_9FIRM|nr:ORF6N domain-containing protein [Candidatus Aphodocola excrementigallinarum]
MKNEIILSKCKDVNKNEEVVENLIYEVRGKQVMLDSDLARLYECANGTKTINLAVKRHINRFPERFMFRLTKEEYYQILRFQSETLELKQGKYSKFLPYAFTEQGVAMLATVLRTKVAEEVSIRIMDAFVELRKYISSNLIEQKYINDLVLEDHVKIKTLEDSFKKIEEKRKVNEIYFNGQIFDAYNKILEIFKMATKTIIIVDAYADNTILDIIKKLTVDVIIITKPNNFLTKQDIERYNNQYHNLKVYYDNTFHDRYFILDNKKIYHCGASINRIGYKTFSITLMQDNEVCGLLMNKISKII